MNKYTTTAVFTPTTVARVTFVEREDVNQRLVNALRTPGKQIVIYGRSGGGKTTLLENKLHQIYENHIKSQCLATTTFDELMLSAFDQLAPFFIQERTDSLTRTSNMSAELKAAISQFAEAKAGLGSRTETSSGQTSQRALPPQLTPTTLAQLLGGVHACWVIEDLHKSPEDTRRLVAQTMKLFMDSADRYPTVRIIVLGAVGSARDIIKLDREMWNRVSEIEVDLMEPEELEKIITLGEQYLNVMFPGEIKAQIVQHANGLAAVCHQLCLNMCMDANVNETCEDAFEFDADAFSKALATWIADATDSLRQTYDTATRTARVRRYDNCRIIVHALATFPRDGATHPKILAKIREGIREYPAGNLSNYLDQLQSVEREHVILHDEPSGRFYFADPMLAAYARALARRAEATRQAEAEREQGTERRPGPAGLPQDWWQQRIHTIDIGKDFYITFANEMLKAPDPNAVYIYGDAIPGRTIDTTSTIGEAISLFLSDKKKRR